MRFYISVMFVSWLFCSSAYANDKEGFITACVSATQQSEKICSCLADKADNELGAGGFEFLLATLNKDKQKSEALRWKMTTPEFMEAGTFMANAPDQCAKKLSK